MRPVLWVRRLWGRVAEPRHLKASYAVIYALTVAVGLVTLVKPPRTIEGPLGAAATTGWACAFILGGLLGLLTVFPGWWWAERIAIGFVLIGLAIYITVVIMQHIEGLASGGSRLTQLGIIILAATPFLLRVQLIREYLYEPRRE